MYHYVQLDIKGKVISVSSRSEPFEHPSLIELTGENIGKVNYDWYYINNTFYPPCYFAHLTTEDLVDEIIVCPETDKGKYKKDYIELDFANEAQIGDKYVDGKFVVYDEDAEWRKRIEQKIDLILERL
jgi:hypothetical protein